MSTLRRIVRAFLFTTLIAAILSTAYLYWLRHQAITAHADAEAAATRARVSTLVSDEMTVTSVRDAWRAAHRVAPDRRCLDAASALLRLKGGPVDAPKLSARYNDEAHGWSIMAGERVASTLPELPDIEDCYRLLDAVAGASPAAARYTEEPDPTTFAGADKLLEALRALDDGTPVTAWDPARIHRVADSLLYLQLQGMDLLDIDAQLPALVLAFDALAAQRSGVVHVQRRALLAHLFGYDATAAALVAELGEADPVRLFVLRQDAALQQRAARLYSDDLMNYLVLRRMAERGDYQGWSDWVRRYAVRDMQPWSVWQTAMSLNSFSQQSIADVVPHVLAMQMRFLAQRETIRDGFARLGLDAPAPDLFALLEMLVLKVKFSAGVLDDFEDALDEWSRRFTGSVVTASLVRDYFNAYFYSTVAMAGRYRLDRLASVPEARAWYASVSQGTTGLGRAYAEWYGQLVALEEGSDKATDLLGTLARPGPLGARPRQRLFREIAEQYLPAGSHENRAALRAILPFIDSRPDHADDLSHWLRRLLYETNQSERLFEHAARNARSDDISPRLWNASMRGDATTLRDIAGNQQVNLDDRRYAVSLLANPLKEPPDALDQAYAQVYRDGRRDFDTVRWFAHRALERSRPAEAREAVQAWLALELKDPGLQRVIMRATLSRALYAEGDFQRAWEAVEPVLASGQGGALRAGARAAARLGRQEEAQRIWDYVRKRYPEARTHLDYAQFLWEQRRHTEAADAILAGFKRPRSQDWAFVIAPAFFETTRDWADADIVAAFDALKPRGIPGHLLTHLPAKFSGEGRHALAFRMRQGLRDSELGHVELLVTAYRDLRDDRGPGPALAWLREAIPPRFLNASSMVFYKQREPDLLWDLIRNPDDGAYGEWVWLIRAASAVRDAEQSPERLRQLHEYFDDDDDPVELLGRYLLGLEDEDAVRQYPWPAQNIYEAAYFLGLKEHCRGNLQAAADWYQVVVELAAPNKGEFHWAQDQLFRWHAAGQLLSRQPAGCEAPDRTQRPGA